MIEQGHSNALEYPFSTFLRLYWLHPKTLKIRLEQQAASILMAFSGGDGKILSDKEAEKVTPKSVKNDWRKLAARLKSVA